MQCHTQIGVGVGLGLGLDWGWVEVGLGVGLGSLPKRFYNPSGRVGGWVVKSEYIATLRPNPQVFPTSVPIIEWQDDIT